MIFGLALQQAGIDVIRVSASHSKFGPRIKYALVPSESDRQRLHDWATERGIPCESIEIATPEQIREWESLS